MSVLSSVLETNAVHSIKSSRLTIRRLCRSRAVLAGEGLADAAFVVLGAGHNVLRLRGACLCRKDLGLHSAKSPGVSTPFMQPPC